MSQEPIKTLHNYPSKIQERVKSLEIYKDKIPTTQKKVVVKVFFSIVIIVIISLVLRYVIFVGFVKIRGLCLRGV